MPRFSATVTTAALVAGGLIGFAAPAVATAPADAQIASGNAFLTNGFVEVGSRPNGTFGSSVSAPAGYHPRTTSGTILGFRADRDQDGWGVGVDDGDFFTPGSPYEGWGFQVGDGATTRWNTNNGTDIPGTYSGTVLSGNTAQATWSSTAPVDGLSVTQVDTVPSGDLYLGVDVTLTNTTGSTMTNVYYVRGLDPDNCKMVSTVSCDSDGDGVADSTGVYSTHNTIVEQERDGDPLSVASATQTDGSYLDLRSPETGSLAATAAPPFNFCRDPQGLDLFYTAPTTVDGSACPMITARSTHIFEDDMIYQLVKTPTLAAGASRTIHLQYFLNAAAAGGTTAQVITFPQPGTALLSASHITLTATADSGLAVTYTSSAPAVCTVSGSTVTLIATGTCTVSAAQAGNPTFSAATPVSRSFTVANDPVVPAPVPPAAANLSSTGVATAPQHVTATIPTGGSVSLVNGSGQLTDTVTVATVGVYTLTAATEVITFTPTLGYSGTPAGVTYRVTNNAGLSNTGVYEPTVTKPAAPSPIPLHSTGPAIQHATITHQDGDSLTLLDSAGNSSSAPVTIAGEGTYTLDLSTATITFSPAAGFTGTGTGVGYMITDPYGQPGLAAYVPTVAAVVQPSPTPVPSPTPAPVLKPLPKIDRKELAKIPADPKAATGKERKTKAFNSSFTGVDAYPIVKLGNRQLRKNQATTLSGDGLFDFDSARLTKNGRAQVKAVVQNLKGSSAVHCEGYTDYAGARDHELDLSADRAKAVCMALKVYGAKITTKTKGYGPQRPVVIGGTPHGRKENRRVVILVTK